MRDSRLRQRGNLSPSLEHQIRHIEGDAGWKLRRSEDGSPYYRNDLTGRLVRACQRNSFQAHPEQSMFPSIVEQTSTPEVRSGSPSRKDSDGSLTKSTPSDESSEMWSSSSTDTSESSTLSDIWTPRTEPEFRMWARSSAGKQALQEEMADLERFQAQKILCTVMQNPRYIADDVEAALLSNTDSTSRSTIRVDMDTESICSDDSLLDDDIILQRIENVRSAMIQAKYSAWRGIHRSYEMVRRASDHVWQTCRQGLAFLRSGRRLLWHGR